MGCRRRAVGAALHSAAAALCDVRYLWLDSLVIYVIIVSSAILAILHFLVDVSKMNDILLRSATHPFFLFFVCFSFVHITWDAPFVIACLV